MANSNAINRTTLQDLHHVLSQILVKCSFSIRAVSREFRDAHDSFVEDLHLVYLSRQYIPMLQKLTNLKCLTVTNCFSSKLSTIGMFSNLIYLDLGRVYEKDLSGLSGCNKLETLSLTRYTGSNLDGILPSCNTLTNINLDTCYSLDDINVLGSCTKLETLGLVNLGNINSIDALSTCVSLKNLRFRDDDCIISNLNFLSPLAVFGHQLKFLELTGFNKVNNLVPLASCTSLVYLYLERFDIIDNLEPLISCVNLKDLVLYGFDSVVDVSPLTKCPALVSVIYEFDGDNVVDTTPLARYATR